MTRDRRIHVEQVWGTAVSIDVPLHRCDAQAADRGIAAVVAWLHDVDVRFSTFRADSEVSRLRDGRLELGECSAELSEVLERCRRLRDVTHGRFDPWAVPGGFDPSGLVKGWAADRAAALLEAAGAADCLINAGGDVTVRGGPLPGRQWHVGLQHPTEPGEVYGSVTVTDCAVATSGSYERGEHVWSPRGLAAMSATVVGPDGATADALATALLIEGIAGLGWLTRLPAYSAQVVAAGTVTATGPAFVTSAG